MPPSFTKKLLYFIFCLVLFSCSNNDDSPSNNIFITSLVENQIIDSPIQISATINTNNQVIEVFVDDSPIYDEQGKKQILFDLDPEKLSTGNHVLRIQTADSQGRVEIKELNFVVHRRLITINLPEKMVSEYIINAVAFASKMDGTLISATLFTRDDETVTLSSPDEFNDDQEFMLTFALTDNGYATGMSTHANLTRSNPGVINLTKPFRGIEGEAKTYSLNGFGNGAQIWSWNINEPYNSDYRIDFDMPASTFTVTIIDDIDGDNHDPEIFYLYTYDISDYKYLMLYPPLDDNFVLDKADFKTDGVEPKSIVFNSTHSPDAASALMFLFGYWTANDYAINNFHQIERRSVSLTPGNPMSYYLNSNFYEYRYRLRYQNYYSAGIGVPESNISIPNNTLDFTFANNKIDFDITGSDHIIGRIRLNDSGNYPVYVWDITFNSTKTNSFILPQLPPEMNKSKLLSLYKSNLMKVASTELVSYRGIQDYEEYLQKVIKNHVDPLKVSDGQELIFKANVPYYDGPIRDFPFQ